jgi:F0F1-type ATP synthase assembly protein I
MLESGGFMQSRNTDHPLVIMKNAFPPSVIGVMVVQVAAINGLLILGGVLLGLFLDRQFGTRPALTLTLGIGGAIAAGVLTYLAAMRTVKKAREAYLEYADKKKQEGQAAAGENAPVARSAH